VSVINVTVELRIVGIEDAELNLINIHFSPVMREGESVQSLKPFEMAYFKVRFSLNFYGVAKWSKMKGGCRF
jgi:hypothetical protein